MHDRARGDRGTYFVLEGLLYRQLEVRHLEVSPALLEELLESFVTAGLGLIIESKIKGVSQLPELHLKSKPDLERLCAIWHAMSGRVTICATYHSEHSRRVKGHVVWLEWWTPSGVHHDGRWRVEPRWPRDWIIGHG